MSIQGEMDKNKVSLLNRMFTSQNTVIEFVSDVCGKAELMSNLVLYYGVPLRCSAF